MSQNSWEIYDGTTAPGPEVTPAIKAAIQAAMNNHYGETRPVYLEAGGIWCCSTDDTLYLYDGTDDIALPTLDSVLSALSGDLTLGNITTGDIIAGTISATDIICDSLVSDVPEYKQYTYFPFGVKLITKATRDVFLTYADTEFAQAWNYRLPVDVDPGTTMNLTVHNYHNISHTTSFEVDPTETIEGTTSYVITAGQTRLITVIKKSALVWKVLTATTL